jgi:hypothetical protein
VSTVTRGAASLVERPQSAVVDPPCLPHEAGERRRSTTRTLAVAVDLTDCQISPVTAEGSSW